MPKLKPATQALRRDHILDAAERCFAQSGFHRTTTHDICREAAISPGALYVHFDSKEALIAGLCERDRAQFTARFRALSDAPDLLDAMRSLGTQYFVDEPPHKTLFVAEMGIESTRNPHIAEIYRSVDGFCLESFEKIFAEMAAAGRINPGLDAASVARLFQIIGDGIFWRRAVRPDFDFNEIREALLTLIERLLVPAAPTPSPGPAPARTTPRSSRKSQK